jgi:hypothetical protein
MKLSYLFQNISSFYLKIGGKLSLFVGISIISILEILEITSKLLFLPFENFLHRLTSKKDKKMTETKVNNYPINGFV